MFEISALERHRQEGYKFKVIHTYIVNLRSIWATGDTVSREKKLKQGTD